MMWDDFDVYQNDVLFSSGPKGLPYCALGLASEAGEVAGAVEKHARFTAGFPEPGDETRRAVAEELGDVLWYVARTARGVGYTLSQVVVMNIEKLTARYPDRFRKGDG